MTRTHGVTSIGEWAFYYCRKLTTLNIGSSVKTIGAVAFSCCNGLTSLTIPASVTYIGNAFQYCSDDLTEIICLNTTPPVVAGMGLGGIDKNTTVLYVPENSVEAYESANEWENFVNIRATVLK